MNRLRSRFALLLLFWGSAKGFDVLITTRPPGEYWDMAYFGSAATVDWAMYRLTPLFVAGDLRRDVEALCIASIVTNALGFALYMADSPPSIYNWIIKGINYVLAIRLTIMGGGDVFNYFDWRGLVRGAFTGRLDHQAKEAKR